MSFYKSDAEKVKPGRNAFKLFVVTQAMGRYNMASHSAMEDVGIKDGEYMYILEHYDELSKEYCLDVDSEEVQSRVALRLKHGF